MSRSLQHHSVLQFIFTVVLLLLPSVSIVAQVTTFPKIVQTRSVDPTVLGLMIRDELHRMGGRELYLSSPADDIRATTADNPPQIWRDRTFINRLGENRTCSTRTERVVGLMPDRTLLDRRNPCRQAPLRDIDSQGLTPPTGTFGVDPLNLNSTSRTFQNQLQSIAHAFLPTDSKWLQTELCVDSGRGRAHPIAEHVPQLCVWAVYLPETRLRPKPTDYEQIQSPSRRD